MQYAGIAEFLQTSRHFRQCPRQFVHVEIGVAEEKLVAGGWGVDFVVIGEGGEVDAFLGEAGGEGVVAVLGG